MLVLGGGPAGASAALALARRGVSVAVVDPLGFGGRLINLDVLRDCPGPLEGTAGWDLAATLGEQALLAGVEAIFAAAAAVSAEPAGGWRVTLDDSTAPVARAVLIATGTRHRPLPGDEEGALAGRGASYCAVCDAALFAGAPVAVYGAGDRALAEVLTVGEHASAVHWVIPAEAPPAAAAHSDVVALRSLDVLLGTELQAVRPVEPADATEPAAAIEPAAVTEPADATDAGRGLVLTLRTADAQRELHIAAVFGAHGELPNTEAVAAVVPCDDAGFVRTDAAFACPGRPGLFAAGDVRAGASPYVAAALGEGTAAGLAIAAFLGV